MEILCIICGYLKFRMGWWSWW